MMSPQFVAEREYLLEYVPSLCVKLAGRVTDPSVHLLDPGIVSIQVY